MLSFSALRPWGPQSQLSGGLRFTLHDTNLNTLSTQTPRGQELLERTKKSGKSKRWLCFSSSFNFMKRVLDFM